MCVIIVKPAGVTISNKTLKQCMKTNPDGAGIAYIRDNKLSVIKGLWTEDELLSTIKPLTNDTAVIHLRLTTHGRTVATQCHPFVVEQQLKNCKTTHNTDAPAVLFHNGMMDFGCMKYSDTLDFTQNILAHIPTEQSRVDLLENLAQTGQRFVYMTPQTVYTIGDFEKLNGLQFSNLNWLRYQPHRKLPPLYTDHRTLLYPDDHVDPYDDLYDPETYYVSGKPFKGC